jgi:hypothetical protein
VADKAALGKVFSEYFGFPANLHSTNYSTITIIYYLVLVNKLVVAGVPTGLPPNP